MLPDFSQRLRQESEHSAYFHQLQFSVEKPISERKQKKNHINEEMTTNLQNSSSGDPEELQLISSAVEEVRKHQSLKVVKA